MKSLATNIRLLMINIFLINVVIFTQTPINIFTLLLFLWNFFNILIFFNNRKINYFDPFNVLLAIANATNITYMCYL